ncbi:MAG: hypothetical protein HYY06_10310 [Deltaproteobacteria bacterium]|nr:hypothetical protein [Deltaproteobacteria bacterium]
MVPGSAAYLAHVALECALKARLLSRDGYASAEALAEKQPRVHAALFRSTQGHDLAALAGYLRLNAFVETQGKPWLDDDCWKRMASSQRPYSLRYGAEPVAQASTQEEINRASALVEVLLQGLKTPPLRKKRRGTR